MADKITATSLNGREEVLNASLAARNVESRVAWQGRNGYVALDLLDSHGNAMRNMTVGTNREVYDFMDAMVQALGLVNA